MVVYRKQVIMHYISLLLLACILATASAAPRPTPPFYRKLTVEQANRLASWDKTTPKQNFWQLSGQTEGDMVLRSGQRNGLIDTSYRWPNNEIPYEFDPIFNEDQRNQISNALTAFAASSCVTARPRTDADRDFVYITGDNSGCWSYIGRLGGGQRLNLQVNGCLSDSTIVHEFLHALGFFHEQSSTERDDYVTIMWENIITGYDYNFAKYEADVITNFGQLYDYLSVMHYDAYAFTGNGQPTIVTIDPDYMDIIGRVDGMSQIDINKLNLMYNC